VSTVNPSPSAPQALIKPVYFFWLLIMAEVGLLVFLIAQFPHVQSQKTEFISLRDQHIDQGNQAEQLQAQLQKLAADLLQLAETDPQAQALAAKYQIRRAPAPR
jgi:hypothetical protein